jgi:DegV family protein with EDD domain
MIKIIADTTSTISPAEAGGLGIYYLPQLIIFGDTSYRDDYEINSQEFLKRLRASSTLPKTAAPPPALYTPIYEEIRQGNHSGIVVCPSAKVSGTYDRALAATKDFPDLDIRVVDTGVIGPALGTLVKKAHQWVSEGDCADTIIDRLTTLGKKVKIYFYVDTLEYLHKGGRIGTAKALVGSILQVKPILLFKDGQVNQFESHRTKKKALARLVELVVSECSADKESHLSILEADAMSDALELSSSFKQHLKIEHIQITDLPPAIIVHAGPGVLAASFFEY